MSENYFYVSHGSVSGPVPFEQLRLLRQRGDVSGATQVRGDSGDWQRLSEIDADPLPSLSDTMAPISGRVAYPSSTIPVQKSDKKRGIFIILGLLLGGMGAHNFYANYFGRGIGQLLLTFVFVALFLPGILVVAVWILVELLLVDTDAEGLKFA